jgi:hypothetical protein
MMNAFLQPRNFSLGILCSWLFLLAATLHCQEAAPLADEASADPAAGQTTAAGSSAQRDVSLRQLPRNFISDQKDLWFFPGKLAQGRHWLPTIGVVGATAGLLAADPHDVSYFRRTSNFHGFNRAFSGKITALEIGILPASFYVLGLARKDSYSQKTALFAGEAIAGSLVLYAVINGATRRVAAFRHCSTGPFQRYVFSRSQWRFQPQLPFRAHHSGVFGGNSFRDTLPDSPLGAVGRLRGRRSHSILTHHVAIPFSSRCIPGRGSGLLHQPLRRAARALTPCSRIPGAETKLETLFGTGNSCGGWLHPRR